MIDAIILARGGSKGIPKKNLKLFCGKPLIAWTILQAKLSKKIDNVYVSSDSLEILNISKKYGAKIIKRPSSISGDKAKSESAILHALTVLGDKQKGIVMLEPTAPLRSPNDLDNCIKLFIDQNWDSGFSGAYLADFLIWKNTRGKLKSINYDSKKQGPRQMREPDIVENGAIYIFKPNIMKKYNNRFGGNVGMYPMSFWQSFEIDEIEDWTFVSLIFKNYLLHKYKYKYKFKKNDN
ncbi:acylneuraminate cytidylyltransferase family protein [Candidatus Pelagibacter sp.]|nr:acylneuraminate cytidylyltransferase family protein [Candidatus Pelagibacter sp.]